MKNVIIIVLAFFPLFLDAQQLGYQINAFAMPTHGATYARMNARESSQEIDAVFFNPAGTTSLPNGFHLSFNNQSQFIRTQIVTEYEGLNEKRTTYPWNVDNFLFPELFVAWKRNKIAISGMITPAIGGGGATTFTSLPAGDLPIADLTNIAEILYGDDIDYDYDFSFGGLAYLPSFYAGVAYQITPFLSASGGVRYSHYIFNASGHVKDLTLTPSDGTAFTEGEQDVADLLSSLIDVKINAQQRGFGVTPIVGLNYNYKNKFYLSGKFEYKTSMTLTTKVKEGEGGSFIPGTDGIFVDKKKSGRRFAC